MVNAAPGASLAFRAPSAGSAPDAWCWATARTSPVDALTATISPEFGTPSRAVRAASCTLEPIVVRTGVPAEAGPLGQDGGLLAGRVHRHHLGRGRAEELALILLLEAGKADRGAGSVERAVGRSRWSISPPTSPTRPVALAWYSRWACGRPQAGHGTQAAAQARVACRGRGWRAGGTAAAARP